MVVEVGAAGVNYIDTYHRGGVYQVDLPLVLGLEGAGRVAAVGDGVDDVAVGDRVAWTNTPGSYAEHVAVPAEETVPVPDAVRRRLRGRRAPAGHDGLDPRQHDLPRAAGRRRARARRGGRRRAAAHPAGHRARRPRDRHRVHRREGGAGQGRGRRRGAALLRRPCRAGARPHRRRRRGGGLRRGRQVDLRRQHGLPAPPRHARALRRGERAGAAGRPAAAQRGRLALPHPPRRSSTTSPRARSCSARRRASTRRWPRAAWTSASATATPLDEARAAHEDLHARRTTGKLVLIP